MADNAPAAAEPEPAAWPLRSWSQGRPARPVCRNKCQGLGHAPHAYVHTQCRIHDEGEAL
eukprot:3963817-Prymnesium_polylepis.1